MSTTPTTDAPDYKATINLPQTEFPMQAKSAEREPQRLARWAEQGLARQIIEARTGAPDYVLHDGPPYANGDIHIGHALNKILKDLIVRFKTMTGHRAHYVPGWDCHGLPIEQKVLQKLGNKARETTPVDFRRQCHEYAQHWIDVQREQFKRLGVGGDWDHPYLTIDPKVEAGILSALRDLVARGLVKKGFRPVYWDWVYHTALAEAEIEYETHVSDSIYVVFPLNDAASVPGLAAFADAALVIWTTTPWTLPANLGVSLNAGFEYVVLEQTPAGAAAPGHYIVARELAEGFCKACKLGEPHVVGTVKPTDLDRRTCQHPIFPDKPSLVMLGNHVTLEAGTGCVHTAPGHGADDFNIGRTYGLPVFVPVDGYGRFTSDYPEMQGEKVFDTNPKIIEKLTAAGLLLGHVKIEHQYPHSWRSHKPIIFRATEQWFMELDAPDAEGRAPVRERALKAIDEAVQWIPDWGRDRIFNMVSARPNWCLSRQRAWGVPIPSIRSKSEGKSILVKEIVDKVIEAVRERGTDVWFTEPLEAFWPAGWKYEATGEDRPEQFEKEFEVLDVWFDSGATHIAVLEERAARGEALAWPADLYLEGADQHRGWFQSSLLVGIGARDGAPYRAVLTHGFVLDGKGEAMSKSKGNTISPQDIIKEVGADGLRLWVISEDYRADMTISKDIVKRVGEAYRRIRNTFRFLLGNLADFDPARHALPVAALEDFDRWALHQLHDLTTKVRGAYDSNEYHRIYHLVHNFCAVTLGALYLDVIKDRLYCSAPGDATRRSAQTTCHLLLDTLVRLVAPVLVFTADEVWEYGRMGPESSVHLAKFPEAPAEWRDEALAAQWESLLELRGDVSRALEEERRAKVIGHSLEAGVELELADASKCEEYSKTIALLKNLFIVSHVRVVEASSTSENPRRVRVQRAAGSKCERCWKVEPEVGADATYPTLCPRCADVVRRIN